MFPYTEKYNEYDKRIKNNHFQYKTHQQHQNTFRKSKYFKELDIFKKSDKENEYFVIYHNSIIHLLYILYILYFLYIYILILIDFN